MIMKDTTCPQPHEPLLMGWIVDGMMTREATQAARHMADNNDNRKCTQKGPKRCQCLLDCKFTFYFSLLPYKMTQSTYCPCVEFYCRLLLLLLLSFWWLPFHIYSTRDGKWWCSPDGNTWYTNYTSIERHYRNLCWPSEVFHRTHEDTMWVYGYDSHYWDYEWNLWHQAGPSWQCLLW